LKGSRVLAIAAALAALAALVAPEFQRYAAERRVGFATAAFRSLLSRTGDAETASNILRVGQLALTAVPTLPGDPRPWIIAGSAYVVTRQPERALENYREAFATGERAEIDLNLGRAYALAGRNDDADAALLRAGWVSPEILASLPAATREPLLARIAALAQELTGGRLTAPPPLPEPERR
jgi:tetratricopeptide (TPR) repeat protein